MIIVTILHHNRVYISNADTTVLTGWMQADVTAVLRHKQRICLQMNLKLLRLFVKPLWGLEE